MTGFKVDLLNEDVTANVISATIVHSLNSPFFPPHIGAEPGRSSRAGEKRVQDNLHAHAQNEPMKNY